MPMRTYRGLRQAFRQLNRWFMIPVFRSGLGPAMVSPFAGYIMLLSTIGHKTGRLRRTPVNYALIDGDVYCIAGFGAVAHWARNLAAIPEAEVLLPAGRVWGPVHVLTKQADRLRVGRQILKNAGFAGFLFGYNAFTITDEKLAAGIADAVVLRITPSRVISGTFDPGGSGWIGATVGWILLLVLLIAALVR